MRWHTVDESIVYAWTEQDMRSRTGIKHKFGSGYHAYCSLDEYCFPHLGQEALAKRNVDQTLTRYHLMTEKEPQNVTEKTKHSIKHSPANEARLRRSVPLIAVPQAFIWEVDDLLIIALPVAPPQTFWKLVASFRFLKAKEFIGLLLYAIVEAFDPWPTTKVSLMSLPIESDKHQRIFKVFSRSIALISDQVSEYLDDEDVDNITAAREHGYIHRIQDIREEISMIRSIILQQEEVWRDFVSNAWPDCWKEDSYGHTTFRYTANPKINGSRGKSRRARFDPKALFEVIGQPQHLFKKYKQRLQRLDDDAARVERSIELRLDLKQKHASLREARKATLMSASVIGFTLITAIFTPLSFMVSLFALPIDRFQTSKIGSGDDAYYTTSYIGKWISKSYHAHLTVLHSQYYQRAQRL